VAAMGSRSPGKKTTRPRKQEIRVERVPRSLILTRRKFLLWFVSKDDDEKTTTKMSNWEWKRHGPDHTDGGWQQRFLRDCDFVESSA
jgi:hypothetical protein